MKIRLTLVLSLLAITSSCLAQRLNFYLNAKVNRYEVYVFDRAESFISTDSEFVNDTTRIFNRYTNSFTQRKNYNADLGFELTVTADVMLHDRISLGAGLGLGYSSFSLGREQFSNTRTFVNSVTVVGDFNANLPDIPFCDRFTNTRSDLPDLNREERVTLYDLLIPVSIEYKLIREKLDLQLGVLIQTPVNAEAKREFYTTRREAVGNEIVCTHAIGVTDNFNLKKLKDVKFSPQAFLRYHFFDGLRVDLGVRKAVSDTFYNTDFQFDENEYKPLNYSLGFSYALAKSKLSRESDF